jgi:hypothetical protein
MQKKASIEKRQTSSSVTLRKQPTESQKKTNLSTDKRPTSSVTNNSSSTVSAKKTTASLHSSTRKPTVNDNSDSKRLSSNLENSSIDAPTKSSISSKTSQVNNSKSSSVENHQTLEKTDSSVGFARRRFDKIGGQTATNSGEEAASNGGKKQLHHTTTTEPLPKIKISQNVFLQKDAMKRNPTQNMTKGPTIESPTPNMSKNSQGDIKSLSEDVHRSVNLRSSPLSSDQQNNTSKQDNNSNRQNIYIIF